MPGYDSLMHQYTLRAIALELMPHDAAWLGTRNDEAAE